MSMLTEDRFRVRTHLNVNMVVEAGAGTGKTTLLIDRLCFALLAQGVAASRMVALTFTEKAGAEIKTRLISKLQAILRSLSGDMQDETLQILLTHFSVPKETIRQRTEEALNQLDRSSIGTIHSFCSEILRSYPLEAGLPPNAEVDRGPLAKAIFEAEWNHFLDQELGLQAQRADIWKEILPHVTLAELKECASQMCSGKIEQYDYFAQKDKLIQVLGTSAARATELACEFLEENKKPRAVELALQQAARRFLASAQWLSTREVAAEEETVAVHSIPKNWDEESALEAQRLLHFSAAADPTVQERILTVYQLLDGLVKKVRGRYTAEGILSFDDLIIKTRNLLKNNLLVRRRLQESFDVFFIDEFQDTDPAQGEMLLFLAEQKGNGATCWQEVKLAPGKLFVVGDPKQSIYRFRGADITAYELFTDLILKQGGEKAYLRQNFRSEKEIVALANDVCSAVMKEKPAFQPFYEPIFTTKQENKEAAELVLMEENETFSSDDYRENQAQFIAQWIEENVGKMSLRNGKKLRYKDIALLFRSGTKLMPYTHALRRANIAFCVEEDRDFYRRQEVNDLLNLLRCINDPEDKIALAGVMRSPWGGLSDEEVYQAYARQERDYRQPSCHEKLEDLFRQLRHFHARADKEPLGKFLHGLLEESFIAEACAMAYDGERSMATLEKIVSLAQSSELEKPTTLGQFLSRIEELMEQELSRLTALPEGEATDAVNIMTVHKSKGLEFPVVILADISKRNTVAANKSNHLYSWKYDLHGLRVGKYPDINLAWLEEEQQLHAQCEEIRILYVALTRAREKMIVLGNAKMEAKTIASMFMRAGRFPTAEKEHSLGGEARLKIRYVPVQEPSGFIYRQKPVSAVAGQIFSLENWKNLIACRQSEYQAYKDRPLLQAPSNKPNPVFSDPSAMKLGTVIHAALAYLWHNPQSKVETACTWGCHIAESEDLWAPAKEVLAFYLASSLHARLCQMDPLAVEMPFIHQTEQGVQRGTVDLLLQDSQGTVWIIDYKTDHVEEEELEQAALQYHGQITAYKQAVEKLYPNKKVKTAVVFVRNAEMIEL